MQQANGRGTLLARPSAGARVADDARQKEVDDRAAARRFRTIGGQVFVMEGDARFFGQ